jgi:hypothetical protein
MREVDYRPMQTALENGIADDVEAPTLFVNETVVIDAADRVLTVRQLEDIANLQRCDGYPLPLILAHGSFSMTFDGR